MTADGTDLGHSASRSSPQKLVTLEILFTLLQSRGLNDTAACLQREAGLSNLSVDKGGSPGSSPAQKGDANLSELVAPATEEALKLRSHAASLSQAEQRRRIASLATEMSKQGQQMAEIRDLVHRVRSTASSVQRPSLEEQEEKIKMNDAEIRELELICSERDALSRNLRMELDRTAAEVADLRRTLEEHEDKETKARIELTKLEEEAMRLSAELGAVPAPTQARKIQDILSGWYDQDGHLQLMIRQLFLEIDRDRDGRLEWNNNEIRNFVHELFHRNGILLPNWQEHVWYDMYRRADVNGSYSLELDEAMRFARSCFEAALALVLTGQSENSTDATVMGEWWTKTHMAEPVARQAMTYSSGVVIDFIEHATIFGTVISANSAHRVRMVSLIETGEHLKATMKTYRDCDKDGNGRLTWNNGEIRDFITACFHQHGLYAPSEEQIYGMYVKFDKDKNNALDMRECLEMVDALFRSTFIVHEGSSAVHATVQNQPAVTTFARSVSPIVQPATVQAHPVGHPIVRQVRGVSPGAHRRLTPESHGGSIRAASPSAASPSQQRVVVGNMSPRTSVGNVSPRTQQPNFVLSQQDASHLNKGVELERVLGGSFNTGPPGQLRTAASPQFGGGNVALPAMSLVPSGPRIGAEGRTTPGIPIASGMIVSPRQREVSPASGRNVGSVVIQPVRSTSPLVPPASPRSTTRTGLPGGTLQQQTSQGSMLRSGMASPSTSRAGSHVAGALTGSLNAGNVLLPGQTILRTQPRSLY
jgi:hypothetical protein